MAVTVRRLEPAMSVAIAQAHNLLCAQSALVGALFHADKTSLTTTDQLYSVSQAVLQVTVANATDLPSCVALMNNISGFLQTHLKDGITTSAVSAGAHKIPDTVNTALIPAIYAATGVSGTDLPVVIASANSQKALINAHFTQAAPSAVHFTNDGTNTIATANATVLGDSITLLNAIKTALNAHVGSAPTTPMVNLVAP